jgi:hypothetical protein
MKNQLVGILLLLISASLSSQSSVTLHKGVENIKHLSKTQDEFIISTGTTNREVTIQLHFDFYNLSDEVFIYEGEDLLYKLDASSNSKTIELYVSSPYLTVLVVKSSKSSKYTVYMESTSTQLSTVAKTKKQKQKKVRNPMGKLRYTGTDLTMGLAYSHTFIRGQDKSMRDDGNGGFALIAGEVKFNWLSFILYNHMGSGNNTSNSLRSNLSYYDFSNLLMSKVYKKVNEHILLSVGAGIKFPNIVNERKWVQSGAKREGLSYEDYKTREKRGWGPTGEAEVCFNWKMGFVGSDIDIGTNGLFIQYRITKLLGNDSMTHLGEEELFRSSLNVGYRMIFSMKKKH